MPHIDPESLSLMALGFHDVPPTDESHLRGCRECRRELEALRDLVSQARSTPPVDMVPPPPKVWATIAAAAAASPHAGTTARPEHGQPPAPAAAATGDGVEPAARPPAPPSAGGNVSTLHARAHRRDRRRPWLQLAAAAMFGAVIGGAAMGVVDDQAAPIAEGPTPVVVTSAELDPLSEGGRDTSGSASVDLEKIGDRRVLGVSTVALEETDGYYEVWLIDPRTMDMISVGAIESGDQVVVLPIPATVDLDKYSVVDISDEPLNGDPTHSNVSVLRGELST